MAAASPNTSVFKAGGKEKVKSKSLIFVIRARTSPVAFGDPLKGLKQGRDDSKNSSHVLGTDCTEEHSN